MDSFSGKLDALSVSNHDKLYKDLVKFRNGRKMLCLINTTLYYVPISNEDEDE